MGALRVASGVIFVIESQSILTGIKSIANLRHDLRDQLEIVSGEAPALEVASTKSANRIVSRVTSFGPSSSERRTPPSNSKSRQLRAVIGRHKR
jgi:hypothetical protein